MRRLETHGSVVTRVVIPAQLACLVVGTALLIKLADVGTVSDTHGRAQILLGLFGIALLSALVTVGGWILLVREHRKSNDLARSMAEERLLTATLERAVASRTTQLDDADRVRRRMWWLGQQITLELNPRRVLERFLEAVADVAQAEGGVVGMVGEDGNIHVVVATGASAGLSGSSVPIATSAMGRVIRSGVPWTIADGHAHADELSDEIYGKMKGQQVRSLAIVPFARRGERIGAVMVVSTARTFSPADLERIEAMSDLLSVSLENAELVETLRQAEWRFRTLFRAAPDAVFTVLESGRIREANDAVRDVTGGDPLQFVGRLVIDLVVEGDRDKLRAALATTFAGSPTRVEVAFHHEGRVPGRRLVAVAMSRLPEADPPSVLLVGRDMTSEREMRLRLMESDRLAAVGELVAGVAHEVNNPLSSISAFAQLLLRDGGLSATQRDSIEVIKSETVRASQVVKDLLAFARRSDPQREPLDLNGVIARTLRLRGYQLVSNKITVETDLATDIAAVVGDARQLQQVCLNLVTNAIQAMGMLGGGTLYVSTRRDGDYVVLDMRDTGPGISEAAKAHIFEPFFTTKGEGEGTGLGLSVSYGIITAHGGKIEVATTSAGGTTFRVTLPAVADAVRVKSRDSAGLAVRSPLLGMRVLFIDDEPSLRAGVQAFGDQRGFSVIAASNGLEGLDLIRDITVDAVVCDLRMPGMDGTSFYDRLRREHPGLAARTVFITGDVVAGSEGAGEGANSQPILTKPFAFEKLEETLVAVMRGAPTAAASAGWS